MIHLTFEVALGLVCSSHCVLFPDLRFFGWSVVLPGDV